MLFLYFFIAFAVIIGLYFAVEASVKCFVDKRSKKHEKTSVELISKEPTRRVPYKYVRSIIFDITKHGVTINGVYLMGKMYRARNKEMLVINKNHKALRISLKKALERCNQGRHLNDDYVKLHSFKFFVTEMDGVKYYILRPYFKKAKKISAIAIDHSFVPSNSLKKLSREISIIGLKKPLFWRRKLKLGQSESRYRKANPNGVIPDET